MALTLRSVPESGDRGIHRQRLEWLERLDNKRREVEV
jgi:hypothetical protein